MTTKTNRPATEARPHDDESHVKKLKLHKLTLLNLSDRELDDVRGGGANTRTCSVRMGVFGCP